MVIFHPSLLRLTTLAAAVLTLCQCETQRTVKSTRSSISFDEGSWGGQGGGQDSSAIRSKFAERGYTITDDGSIKADKPDLYAGQKPRGLDGKFGKKEARFKNMEAETKAFRTPEYLKRQEFAGIAAARESGSAAREGNSNKSKDEAAGMLFKKKTQSTTELATFETGSHRDSNEVFETSADRMAPAVLEAPRATGTPRTMGYQDNVAMSMDDVKKMLNPNAYARGTGLSD
jgi:hypothetical protein